MEHLLYVSGIRKSFHRTFTLYFRNKRQCTYHDRTIPFRKIPVKINYTHIHSVKKSESWKHLQW